MNENIRSVLYAGGLQFCFPGLGRLYLRDWGVGICQLLTSVILVGFLWSWIDGYLMIAHQNKVKRDKVQIIYHGLKSSDSILLNSSEIQVQESKSPISAAVLQLFALGLGRLYWGYWIVGLGQLFLKYSEGPILSRGIKISEFDYSYIGSQLLLVPYYFHSNFDPYHKYGTCCSIPEMSLPIFLLFSLIGLIIRFMFISWGIFDGYCIVKGHQTNPDKKPLNYSVAMSFGKINIESKDKLIAGMLQLAVPGLGRCYLGYWWVGILQLLSSFLFIGSFWSWVDGHHILLDPGVEKDGNGEPLTDQYRLN